tara:strand:+ start:96 stop:569 length:474 start_codon:yes stop_codon:yes gene_type:complete
MSQVGHNINTLVHTTAGKDVGVAGKAVGHGIEVAGKAIGHGTTVAAHAIGEGAKDVGHALDTGATDVLHGVNDVTSAIGNTMGSAIDSVGNALSNAFIPKVGTNPIDLLPDIGGVIDNSVKAIGSFANALCQIIDLGVELGETALNPNAPLQDPLPC